MHTTANFLDFLCVCVCVCVCVCFLIHYTIDVYAFISCWFIVTCCLFIFMVENADDDLGETKPIFV
jgi:hypothetical protein